MKGEIGYEAGLDICREKSFISHSLFGEGIIWAADGETPESLKESIWDGNYGYEIVQHIDVVS